jgi:dihydroorotate dehydrogenase (NAD+) catalytic subunit
MNSPDLSVSIGNLRLKNPVLVASGTFGYGEEMAGFTNLSRLGGIVTKTVTRVPRSGNPPPRTVETATGMLNSIGLENVGIERFIEEKMPFLRRVKTAVIANIAGEDPPDFVALARRLAGEDGIDALELNLSCPNVAGGLDFSRDPELASKVVSGVRGVIRVPLIAKLSPNVSAIEPIARACERAGADALSLINTLVGMAIDIRSRRPRLGNVFGGLSGPAIKPVALAMVHKAARVVGIPVIGIGGIMTGEDAVEFLLAGAAAVQIGTANFIDPRAGEKVLAGLLNYCRKEKVKDLEELVGGLRI